jgi:hypothetical protein
MKAEKRQTGINDMLARMWRSFAKCDPAVNGAKVHFREHLRLPVAIWRSQNDPPRHSCHTAARPTAQPVIAS